MYQTNDNPFLHTLIGYSIVCVCVCVCVCVHIDMTGERKNKRRKHLLQIIATELLNKWVKEREPQLERDRLLQTWQSVASL